MQRSSISAGEITTALVARVRLWLMVVLLIAGSNATGLLAQNSTSESTPLELGRSIEANLAGGQSHEYHFSLQTGQYARVLVEQRTINVRVAVFGPDGKEVFAADAFDIGTPEPVELIAVATGIHRLRVSSSEEKAPLGLYNVMLREAEGATERHKNRAAAVQAFAFAQSSMKKTTREGHFKSIDYLQTALARWQAAGDLAEQARILFWIGTENISVGDRQNALAYTMQALPLAQASHDQIMEGWVLDAIGQVYDNFGDKRKAIEYFDEALALMRSTGLKAGEGNVLNHLGAAYIRVGEKRKALDCFQTAMGVFGQLQDRSSQSTAANNLGATYDEMGENQNALEQYQHALAIRRELPYRDTEALTLSNIALVHLNLGEYQKALDDLRAALDINRLLDNRRGSAINLNNIAKLYMSLGDRRRALQFLEEAAEILRAIQDQWGLAHTLNNIGDIYAERDKYDESLKFYNEALSFARAVGDRDTEAAALNNIGNCYVKLGDREKAHDHLERALKIHRTAGNQRLLVVTLRNLGDLYREDRDYHQASASLDEALKISVTIRDRNAEAAALASLTRLEMDRGNLPEAQRRGEKALSTFESLRLEVLSPKLRASLFASVRQVQELNLEVLMRLHTQQPERGFDAAALIASERGRARSLLEMLVESGSEIRQGVDVALLNHERELETSISAKSEQQTRLLNGKHTDGEAAAAAKELDELATELEQVQSRIRATSPQYAALTQPAPLNLREIQTQVLDEDTVLLEYALGQQRSFLWAVTPSSFYSYELPARAEIEAAARGVYELLTARNQKPDKETPALRAARVRHADDAYFNASAKVSSMLLGPVASLIENKRLLVVGEGVLQYLPFSALPAPDADGKATTVPLIANHEIIAAPSASVVAILRKETAGRKVAKKALAILADPVFSPNDARFAQKRHAITPSPTASAANGANRSGPDVGVQEFLRLRFSRNEAEEIARLAPADGVLKALDFDASRDIVLRPDFGEYRIVHFATHSLLNNANPELSGVVLSLVDRAGRPQNGFLRLYDIYNLRLNAGLVVLSACQTALGEEIKGEGLVGLTRGFLYAGAPRVVATLWKVDDRATSEAMKRFYEGVLARGQRPAAALRDAQVAMWKAKGWGAPYYWAAFTLQGEWW